MRRPELIFDDALMTFLREEGGTLLSDVSERNTCGRLAIYLERQLAIDGVTGYYADVEYNRKHGGEVKTIINNRETVVSITPDLIVHSRGAIAAPHDNLIAVEAKKAYRPSEESNADIDRLIAMTCKPYDGVWNWKNGHPEHVCGYSVGIFMEIRLRQKEVVLQYFKKGKKTKERSIKIENQGALG
jgi:hypothetical protein